MQFSSIRTKMVDMLNWSTHSKPDDLIPTQTYSMLCLCRLNDRVKVSSLVTMGHILSVSFQDEISIYSRILLNMNYTI